MDRRRSHVAVGVGIVLLFLVAAALMPKVFPFRRGSGDPGLLSPETSLVTDAALVALTVVVIAAAVMVQIFARRGSHATPLSRRRPVWAQVLTVIAVLWAVAFVASLLERDEDETRRPSPTATAGPQERTEPGSDAESSEALGLVVTAGLVLLVAGSASLLYVLSRHDRARSARESEAGAISRQLKDAARAVEEAADPRAAVIACFERLELTFSSAGAPRYASDTPHEMVERALVRLEVPEEAARRLTSLFEVARFSTNDVDDPMRERAVEALEEISAHLEVQV